MQAAEPPAILHASTAALEPSVALFAECSLSSLCWIWDSVTERTVIYLLSFLVSDDLQTLSRTHLGVTEYGHSSGDTLTVRCDQAVNTKISS